MSLKGPHAPARAGAATTPAATARRRPRVCVVGSGWRFTGGISHFTCLLAGALAEHTETSAILIRRLMPRMFYPGRKHVGQRVASVDYDRRVDVFDGIDWYWFPSLFTGLRKLRARQPDILLMQWWTGTVAHTYLVLAALARRRGAKVLIEFHEVQDTGEVRIPFVATYTRLLLRWLLRLADGFLVHSEHDRELLSETYDLSSKPVAVVPHGPFAHYRTNHQPAEDGAFRLLFFGLIRPYKGLEHLIAAFDRLSPEEAARYRLAIVGETWEGCTEPIEMIERSPHRDRITLVNRYVTDEEAVEHFSRADALVLPYLRSSASGPLHIAMSNGIPVIVSAVGGLVEAVGDYEGAIMVRPADGDDLLDAIRAVPARAGQVYADPHSWERNVEAVLRFGEAHGADAGQPDERVAELRH
jgi:glycosyltransferase involved in cell wall biosynthesis